VTTGRDVLAITLTLAADRLAAAIAAAAAAGPH
jgi:hypothetical protein